MYKVLTMEGPDKDGNAHMSSMYKPSNAVVSYDKSPQPHFFAYIVRSAEGGFQQLHVFSLINGKERDVLRDAVKLDVPAMDRLMLAAEQAYGEVVIAEYLGCSLVSAGE